MFKKDKVFYKNDDYTVRMEKIDGCERYYIKFHSHDDSPEQEISLDVFKLYYKDFKKPLESIRTEQRRHIESGNINNIISGKRAKLIEQEYGDRADFEAAMKTCTPIQRRRFELYYVYGYSFVEIARMEKRDAAVVRRSVLKAVKKIKKYFS